MTIKERFNEIVTEQKVKQLELAAAMGVKQTTISATLKEGGEIEKITYLIALNKLTGCNINWLCTGDGPKYIKEYEEAASKFAESRIPYLSLAQAHSRIEELTNILEDYKEINNKVTSISEENIEFKKRFAAMEKLIKKL